MSPPKGSPDQMPCPPSCTPACCFSREPAVALSPGELKSGPQKRGHPTQNHGSLRTGMWRSAPGFQPSVGPDSAHLCWFAWGLLPAGAQVSPCLPGIPYFRSTWTPHPLMIAGQRPLSATSAFFRPYHLPTAGSSHPPASLPHPPAAEHELMFF